MEKIPVIPYKATRSHIYRNNGMWERGNAYGYVPQDDIAGTLSGYIRKRIYHAIEELQADLDEWLDHYNNKRTHPGKMCCGRTPYETMIDGKTIWQEKFIG